MNITKPVLLRALKIASAATERRNTIPVLGAIRIVADGSTLTMDGTDLDMTVQVSMPMDCEPFGFCQQNVPSLMALVKAGGDDIDIGLADKDGYELKSLGLKVALGNGLPAEDMPATDVRQTLWSATIGAEFMEKLARVSVAISTEETRYYLNGVYFHHVAEWTYRLVATDGHRLVYADVQIPDADGFPFGIGYIIPRKMVKMLMGLHANHKAAPIRLSLGGAISNDPQKGDALTGGSVSRIAIHIADERGDVTVISKLIDGTFPDYTRVIPVEDEKSHIALVKTADVRRMTGAVVAASTQRTAAVAMKIKGDRITLSTRMLADAGMEAAFAAQAETRGGDFEVGFNARYLHAQAFAAGGEMILFATADPASPVLIYDPESTDVKTVLMPMRVS